MRRVLTIVMRILLALVILYGVYAGMLTALQRSFLYHPQRVAGAPPAQAEQHWIQTAEGPVEAWFMPSTCASGRGAAVIFAHGNAELIDHWPERLAPYRAMGVHVLFVEYRGYGRSAGSATQAAITEDFVAGFDLLSRHPAVDPAKIFFHGRSLGGGVVMALAAKRRPAGIILESTFTSVVAMAKRMGVPMFLGRLLLGDPYDSESVLVAYDGPSLIFHGDRDEVIPFSHGQQLHSVARQGRFVPMRCGHNNAPDDPKAYWAEIHAFLQKNGGLCEIKP